MIKILGVGYDKNSSFLRGSENAPDKIRQMHYDGSANSYCERGFKIDFDSELVDVGNMTFENMNSDQTFESIMEKVSAELLIDHTLISLGGDHSIAYPIIAAHAKRYGKMNVLQIDAHGDLYENFEDNRYSHASPFARLFEDKCLASLTQIGIRSLNPHQRQQVEKYNVNCIEMKDYDTDFINNLQGPIYISLDLDGLDPAFAPGVSHHEPGGFTVRQILHVIHNIKVPIIGADIVELNPLRDVHNITAMVAYKFMKEIASKMLNP
jgi:arginase